MPRLPDVGPAAQQRRLAVWEDVLAQLETIDPAALSPAEQVNYAVYKPQVGNLAASIRFRDYEMPFNSDSSRSEEHTSELQSLMRISYAVFCLTKKKTKKLNENEKYH